MLSRHGSRYPTSPIALGEAIKNVTGKANFTGELSFINSWEYELGVNILTPWGRQVEKTLTPRESSVLTVFSGAL